MALKLHTYTNENLPALEPYPLSVLQLQAKADDIIAYVDRYRPEYANLVRLQRKAGNRITEMFQPIRWTFPTTSAVQVTPQKGNATRVLQLVDLGFGNSLAMAATLSDMQRLPKGQYERIFSAAVRDIGLWRLYDSGYTHPSTHFFRHLKIKELKSQNFDVEYIANWIGEKKIENLNYYLESQFFSEI